MMYKVTFSEGYNDVSFAFDDMAMAGNFAKTALDTHLKNEEGKRFSVEIEVLEEAYEKFTDI